MSLSNCWNAEIYTPQVDTPPGQTPPSWADTLPGQTPPRADTPFLGRHPLGRHPLSTHPLPRDCHCSGRYASYWNAFLFKFLFLFFCRETDERIEVGERELAELRAHAIECREEIDHLKNELAQVDKLKCR